MHQHGKNEIQRKGPPLPYESQHTCVIPTNSNLFPAALQYHWWLTWAPQIPVLNYSFRKVGIAYGQCSRENNILGSNILMSLMMATPSLPWKLLVRDVRHRSFRAKAQELAAVQANNMMWQIMSLYDQIIDIPSIVGIIMVRKQLLLITLRIPLLE